MHSLLFTGHAHALAGRPAQALDALARYTAEVERRQVPRFAGRAVNFAGWVLRNLGAWQEALDHHQQALEAGQGQGTADVTIAALEDLAEQCLETGDPDGARARLAEASALLRGNLVFGWRLRLKHQLLTGRLALLAGDGEQALAQARELEARAAALGVPRYTSVARLLAHRANHALGGPADPDAVAADLDLLDGAAAIEGLRFWPKEFFCDLFATDLLGQHMVAAICICSLRADAIRIIANASVIVAARPALTSASAPFSMTRRFPLPARHSFASIDTTTRPRSGRLALFRLQRRGDLRPAQADFDPIGRDGYPLDNFPNEAFHLDGRHGEPSL